MNDDDYTEEEIVKMCKETRKKLAQERRQPEYQVTITMQELCIIQDALNAYSRATYAPDQSITDTFEMLSHDQEDYTIDQVRILWRSLQSRYTESTEELKFSNLETKVECDHLWLTKAGTAYRFKFVEVCAKCGEEQ